MSECDSVIICVYLRPSNKITLLYISCMLQATAIVCLCDWIQVNL